MKAHPHLPVCTLLALLVSHACASTLFWDDFETNPYSGVTPRWAGYHDDGTNVYSPAPFTSPYYSNWLGSGGVNGSGYIFIQHQTSGTGAQASDYLLHTNSSTDLDIHPGTVPYESLYVSWEQTQSSATDAMRYFSVQVDGQWYVSTSQASFANGNEAFMDFYDATWNPLSVAPGSGGSLDVDTGTVLTFDDLFDGGNTISSLGFYVNMPAADGTTRTVRWDNIEMTSGLIWFGSSGAGGDGTWNSAGSWGGGIPLDVADWSNHQTAIFGHPGYDPLSNPGTVVLDDNVLVRSLGFYEGADGYEFHGTSTDAAAGNRTTMRINDALSHRSIYLAPNVEVTFGGDMDTYLRVYKTSLMHIYGGGTLVVDANALVRTEGGSGRHVVVNDGSTVVVQEGGQFHATDTLNIGNQLETYEGAGGDGHLIVDGGEVLSGTGGGARDLILGGESGDTSITLLAGSITTHATASNGLVFGGGSNNTFNLDGGTLTTKRILKLAGDGSSIFNFNGGALVAQANNSVFMEGLTAAHVQEGGARFDTQGFEIVVRQDLLHDAALGGTLDGGVWKTGTGNLVLGGVNTYTGGTHILEGVVSAFANSRLGANSSKVVIHDGATLRATGTYTLHQDRVIELEGAGAIDVTTGQTLTFRGLVTNGIIETGSLIKTGDGTLILNSPSANNYGGPTIIRGGTLIATSMNQIGLFSVSPENFILDGGTFELDVAVGTSTDRGLTVTANGGTLRNTNAAWRLQGEVTGEGTLYIDGHVYLGGDNNSFTGDIEVLSGEFLVRRSTALGTTDGGVVVHSGAVFGLDHNGTGGGGFSTSLNSYLDHVLLKDNATLRNRGGTGTDAFYSGDIEVESGTGIVDVVGKVLTVHGRIKGAGGVNKTGGGKMVVTSESTYQGKTTISNGIFALAPDGNNVDATLASPWIDIHNGAVFDVTALQNTYTITNKTLSGGGTVAGNITLGQNALLKPGASSLGDTVSLAGDQTGALTFTGSLSLTDNASVYFQVAGSDDYDRLDVAEDFSAGGNTQFVVEWLNFQASLGDEFDFINWGDVVWDDAFEDDLLARLLLPTFSDSTLYWDTGDFLGEGIIRVAAVPEAGRTMLLCCALGCALLRRRRSVL